MNTRKLFATGRLSLPRTILWLGAVSVAWLNTTATNARAQTAAAYTIVDLGAGGGSSYAYGVNDSGYVVGVSSTSNHATLWSVTNGTVSRTDLGTLGGSGSTAYGINDAGLIAGYSRTSDGSVHATLWSVTNGTVSRTDLGTLGGSFGRAYGINNAGLIAGYSSTSDNLMHATRWNIASGAITDLGLLGVTSAASTASTTPAK